VYFNFYKIYFEAANKSFFLFHRNVFWFLGAKKAFGEDSAKLVFRCSGHANQGPDLQVRDFTVCGAVLIAPLAMLVSLGPADLGKKRGGRG